MNRIKLGQRTRANHRRTTRNFHQHDFRNSTQLRNHNQPRTLNITIRFVSIRLSRQLTNRINRISTIIFRRQVLHQRPRAIQQVHRRFNLRNITIFRIKRSRRTSVSFTTSRRVLSMQTLIFRRTSLSIKMDTLRSHRRVNRMVANGRANRTSSRLTNSLVNTLLRTTFNIVSHNRGRIHLTRRLVPLIHRHRTFNVSIRRTSTSFLLRLLSHRNRNQLEGRHDLHDNESKANLNRNGRIASLARNRRKGMPNKQFL